MQRIRGLIVVGVLALGACLHTDEPTRREIGYISVNAPATAQGQVTAQALFFRDPGGLQFPNSRFSADSCETRTFTPGSSLLIPVGVEYISAGDSVGMQTDSATGFLKAVTAGDGTTSYVLPNGGSLPLTPGAPVTFTIPGAPDGFPAATIAGKTAEPYELGPIDTLPGKDSALVVTWSPAGDDSSAVVLSLQYATSGASDLNEQVFCSLRDDGVDTIPGSIVNGWRQSAGLRHVDSYRWRSTLGAGQTELLGLVAQYNVSKSTLP